MGADTNASALKVEYEPLHGARNAWGSELERYVVITTIPTSNLFSKGPSVDICETGCVYSMYASKLEVKYCSK